MKSKIQAGDIVIYKKDDPQAEEVMRVLSVEDDMFKCVDMSGQNWTVSDKHLSPHKL